MTRRPSIISLLQFYLPTFPDLLHIELKLSNFLRVCFIYLLLHALNFLFFGYIFWWQLRFREFRNLFWGLLFFLNLWKLRFYLKLWWDVSLGGYQTFRTDEIRIFISLEGLVSRTGNFYCVHYFNRYKTKHISDWTCTLDMIWRCSGTQYNLRCQHGFINWKVLRKTHWFPFLCQRGASVNNWLLWLLLLFFSVWNISCRNRQFVTLIRYWFFLLIYATTWRMMLKI